MNILVTGGNGQLGNELRLAACHSERSFCHSERSEESRSFGKPQDDKPCFLFTDVNEASEESVAMLKKLGGEGVDTSTTRLDITDLEAIRAIVREHQIIYYNGAPVGVTTSGTHLPFLGVPCAMALLRADGPDVGAKVEVDIRGRRVEAEIVPLPFYRRPR